MIPVNVTEDLKKEIEKWEYPWQRAKPGHKDSLVIPQKEDFDNCIIIPFIRIYPDTVNNTVKQEFMNDKFAVVTKRENIYFWYAEKQNGFSQLTIGKKMHPDFIEQVNSIAQHRPLYLLYFTEEERYILPGYSDKNTAMIIGYNENGKDIFTDIESNKYNSLNKIIQARYGSQIKYFEKY